MNIIRKIRAYALSIRIRALHQQIGRASVKLGRAIAEQERIRRGISAAEQYQLEQNLDHQTAPF